MTHFVLLLFRGDYADASQRRDQGLADRYRHHSYAIESLERIRSTVGGVTVIQVHSDAAYDTESPHGLRFVGLGEGSVSAKLPALGGVLDEVEATHAMLRFPSTGVLGELLGRSLRTSVVLADSFSSPWRRRAGYKRLGSALRNPGVDFVANHHLNASRQLVGVLGLEPAKVIPWDWPLDLARSAASAAKTRSTGPGPRICYVGHISKNKGVWDLLKALAILRRDGLEARLDIAGTGQTQRMHDLIREHGLSGSVDYRGRIGGDEILTLMQASDFVCVPSHRAYPEGLPLTLYEAMASGTPLVASNHPMFAGVVRDGETALVHPAGRAARLAASVTRGWRTRSCTRTCPRPRQRRTPMSGWTRCGGTWRCAGRVEHPRTRPGSADGPWPHWSCDQGGSLDGQTWARGRIGCRFATRRGSRRPFESVGSPSAAWTCSWRRTARPRSPIDRRPDEPSGVARLGVVADNGSARMRVEVVVITFRRPDRLRRALTSLVEASRQSSPGWSIGVSVVDDDPDGSAAPVVAEFASSFGAGTTYLTSGARNISVARNTGLESALDRADWVASIDDDVIVPAEWFLVCSNAIADGRFNAVTGPLVKDFTAGPRWLTDEPFSHVGLLDGEDGEPAFVCATGNNWMSCELLRGWSDLRFDPALGVTGGEDMDFFYRAVERGLHPVYRLAAAVTEPEPPDRCTLRYQVRRAFWLGISEAQISTRLALAGRPRLVARGARRALDRGARQLPAERRADRGWRYTVAVWANCLGLALGCAGLRMQHR